MRVLANSLWTCFLFARLVLVWKGDTHMLKHLAAALVMFTAVMVGLELTPGPSVKVDHSLI